MVEMERVLAITVKEKANVIPVNERRFPKDFECKVIYLLSIAKGEN